MDHLACFAGGMFGLAAREDQNNKSDRWMQLSKVKESSIAVIIPKIISVDHASRPSLRPVTTVTTSPRADSARSSSVSMTSWRRWPPNRMRSAEDRLTLGRTAVAAMQVLYPAPGDGRVLPGAVAPDGGPAVQGVGLAAGGGPPGKLLD